MYVNYTIFSVKNLIEKSYCVHGQLYYIRIRGFCILPSVFTPAYVRHVSRRKMTRAAFSNICTYFNNHILF